eukprot:2140198-Rhodomonas_salina.2
MRASKHLMTLDQQQASLMASELWDQAVADQLLQHHYGIPIDIVNADEAADSVADPVEVPTHSSMGGARGAVASSRPSHTPSTAASETPAAQQKPAHPTQSRVTGAGDVPDIVPPLSGSTSTHLLQAKCRHSVTGGKTADKQPSSVTFASDQDQDTWED